MRSYLSDAMDSEFKKKIENRLISATIGAVYISSEHYLNCLKLVLYCHKTPHRDWLSRVSASRMKTL